MGHLGILPQSVKGKFKFKGKKIKERNKIFNDAKLLQDKGVFSIVLECVETTLAKKITKSLKIPTIGIGSSHHCDGQVLVLDDLIGLNETKIKFVKKFGNIKKNIRKAVNKFKKEVLGKKYPTKKYSY
jgi:3-methyl-2-oxobutanoate hydroxymethyltransferase